MSHLTNFPPDLSFLKDLSRFFLIIFFTVRKTNGVKNNSLATRDHSTLVWMCVRSSQIATAICDQKLCAMCAHAPCDTWPNTMLLLDVKMILVQSCFWGSFESFLDFQVVWSALCTVESLSEKTKVNTATTPNCDTAFGMQKMLTLTKWKWTFQCEDEEKLHQKLDLWG